MKNTLIELAKKHGAMPVISGRAGESVSMFELSFTAEQLEAYSAELLQANSGNAVDERAAFEKWLFSENEGFDINEPTDYGQIINQRETYYQWKAWNARASLANKLVEDKQLIADLAAVLR